MVDLYGAAVDLAASVRAEPDVVLAALREAYGGADELRKRISAPSRHNSRRRSRGTRRSSSTNP